MDLIAKFAMELSVSADDARFMQAKPAVQALIDKGKVLIPVGIEADMRIFPAESVTKGLA